MDEMNIADSKVEESGIAVSPMDELDITSLISAPALWRMGPSLPRTDPSTPGPSIKIDISEK